MEGPGDDDDMILEEIDVYWHGSLPDGAQLNLFQYPLRPRWRPYDSALLQEIRLKPFCHVVEFDYALPRTEVIETHQATLKIERPGGETGEDPSQREFETVRGTHAPMHANYCVGIFKDKAFHLHQVDCVYQMRPDFSHIDREDERRKALARKSLPPDQVNPEDEDFRMPNAEAALAASNAQLPLQVRRQETAKAKEIREKSWAHLKAQEEAEPWTMLNYTYRESHAARTLHDWLTAEIDGDLLSSDFLEPREYLDSLTQDTSKAPVQDQTSMKRPTAIHIPLTQDVIHKLPIPEQVLHFMQNSTMHANSFDASILPFSELMKLVKPPAHLRGDEHKAELEEQVIKALSSCAVYVRGNWVVKSAQVSPPLTSNLIHIRNYILLLFATESEYLQRKELAESIPARPDLIKMLLQPFCIHVKPHGWRLKYPPDTYFIEKFPKWVEKYTNSWESGKAKIIAQLQATPSSPVKTSSSASASAKSEVTNEEIIRDITGFVTHVLNMYGVLNMLAIKQKLEEALKDPKKYQFSVLTFDIFKANAKLLSTALTAVADKWNNAYYLKSVNDPMTNTIRSAVMELFKVKNVYSVAEYNAALAQKLGNRNIPQAKLDEVTRVFAHNKAGSWAFKVSSAVSVDKKGDS